MPAAILLAVFAAGATLRSVELRYRATALMQEPPGYLLFRGLLPAPLDLKKERALLFNAIVLDPVLADPVVRTAPSLSEPNFAEATLRNNLSMDFFGRSPRLIVCYQDTDPEAAAAVCNAVVDSYLRHRRVEKIKTSRNSARRLESEIKHWESEVEQGQRRVVQLSETLWGGQWDERSLALWTSESALRNELRSQAVDLTFKLALLNAQLDQNERHAVTQSIGEGSLPNAERGRLAKQRERKRVALTAELEDVHEKISDEQAQLQPFWPLLPDLLVARDKLQIATEVLAKLRSKVAELAMESRYDLPMRLLVSAIPPRNPINWPGKRMAVFSGIAFFSPLMLGFLLSFQREANGVGPHSGDVLNHHFQFGLESRMPETSASENRIPAPVRPNPWDRLVSLCHHGRWTVPTAILLAVFAASATLRFVAPQYRAGFLLQRNVDYILLSGQTPTPLDLKKERALLFSGKVLDPILTDPTLQTAPSLTDPNAAEASLRNNLSMDFAGTSHRLIVCYQDTDPEAAARVCNAVVDSYLRQRHMEETKISWNSAGRLKSEIKHWESEVEQGQVRVLQLSQALWSGQWDERSLALREFELALRNELRSQAVDLTFQLALSNAQLDQNERRAETQAIEEGPLPDAERGRLAKQRERKRAALTAKLEDVHEKIYVEQAQLQPFRPLLPDLLVAREKLQIATEVLAKLRARVATIQAKGRQDGNLHVLVKATPPRFPINWPPKPIAVFSGIAFFSPLMLGFLLGFRREA